jgi:hypothetical protein
MGALEYIVIVSVVFFLLGEVAQVMNEALPETASKCDAGASGHHQVCVGRYIGISQPAPAIHLHCSVSSAAKT